MIRALARLALPAALAGLALASPAVAGAEGRIAFVSERDGNPEIYVMASDGSAQTRLTAHSEDDLAPAWSPDGTRIAFVRGFGSDADVWLMNADGSDARRVTTADGADREPAWSPDGRRIVFAGDRGDGAEIRVIGADGTGDRALTATGGLAAGPAWSPDGTRIAFWREDLQQLRTVPAAGGDDKQLVASGDRGDRDPAWSLDGTRLAFTSAADPALDLDVFAARADGSGVVPLVATTARETSPAWSADDRIAYATDRDGGDVEIYAMNADGSDQTRLTASPGTDDMPDWEPPAPVALTVEPPPAAGDGGRAPAGGTPVADAPVTSPQPAARRGRLAITLLRSSRIRIEERLVRLRLRVRVTAPARVTLELRRGGRPVVRITRRVRRGVTTLRWTKRIANRARWSGRRYEVFLISLTPRGGA